MCSVSLKLYRWWAGAHCLWGHERLLKGCCLGRPPLSNVLLITWSACFCVPFFFVCCPPLSLPLPNHPTESSRERRDVHGEIKDNCILRKALKFTGQREEGWRVFHSRGFWLWTSPPRCILRSSKTWWCARRGRGAANKRAYFVMMLWCNYVDVLRMLFVLKGMLILTDTGIRDTHMWTHGSRS